MDLSYAAVNAQHGVQRAVTISHANHHQAEEIKTNPTERLQINYFTDERTFQRTQEHKNTWEKTTVDAL